MHFKVKRTFLIIPLLFFNALLHARNVVFPSLDTLPRSSDTITFFANHAAINKDQQLKNRMLLVGGTHIAIWTGTFIALNKAWYADFPRSSFHFFNDDQEWNQMDKSGHFWTNYNVSRISAEMWKWTGLPDNKSVILGGISGVAYQGIIEIQDGFSKEWGFSWGDMSANMAGAAAFVSQQLAWKEQRIQVKLSYSGYGYPGDLISRRNQLFGKSLPERMLKDYNSQTYWISANLKSLFATSCFPAWLNLSIGYGSEGMLGGTSNIWTDNSGDIQDRSNIPRVRRFFIAPDVDLTKIKTGSKFLHSLFFVMNMVKFPAPALELNSQKKWKGHFLYF